MRDILMEIEKWQREGKDIVLATVVRAYGSAPRTLGSKMAISSDLEIAGSVTAGCVEGAVVEEAKEVFATGKPKLLRYGVADETAWDVGLACGGTVEVFVEKMEEA
jgi:xanthine/CO dehydrogenase XdhC/CoxF family maturation factor